MLANRLPREGRMTLSPMLNDDGKLIGDFTVANAGANRFIRVRLRYRRAISPALVRGAPAGRRDDSFAAQRMAGLRDRRAALARAAGARLPRRREQRGVAVPRVPRHRSRRCCRRASAASRSPASWATRSGCRPTVSSSLYDALTAAGADLGLTPFGARALHSLRLEKSFGNWAREYRPIYTPAEAGLDRFVDGRQGRLHRSRRGSCAIGSSHRSVAW